MAVSRGRAYEVKDGRILSSFGWMDVLNEVAEWLGFSDGMSYLDSLVKEEGAIFERATY